MYNKLILEKMQAEKHFALRLDKAVKGVKEQAIQQAHAIDKGVTRLSWYLSCFTSNYQDVCAKQKHEDVRFLLALKSAFEKREVVLMMLEIYVEHVIRSLSEDRITRISRRMTKLGANFASNSLTKQAFGHSVAQAIYHGFGLSVFIKKKLSIISSVVISGISAYGQVQMAAEAANRLKNSNGVYYALLYNENLEMLYFLIEPVIQKNNLSNFIWESDDEIAANLMRLMR